MKPLISVIIPVYNVEKYLDECLGSVLGQSDVALEAILVDDGSTDRSGALCDRHAQQDARVRVLHRANGGLSDARNAGAAAARGELLFFLDADDVLLEETYIETLRAAMEENAAQIAISGMARFEDGQLPSVADSAEPCRVFTATEALCALCYGRPFDHSACGKLLRRECAYGVFFPVGLHYEDLAATYRYFDACQRAVWVPQCHYGYRQRGGSIMQKAVEPCVIGIARERAAEVARRRPECAKAAKYSVCKEAAGVLAQGYHQLDEATRRDALGLVRRGCWPALKDGNVPVGMKLKLLLVSGCPALAAYVSRSGMAKRSGMYRRAKE